MLWVRLAMSKGIGPVTFWKLLQKAHNNIRKACNLAYNLAPESLAEKEILDHEKPNHCLLAANDERFPKNLLELKDCPPMLSVIGNVELLSKPSVAVVGARNASLSGKIFAVKLVRDLGRNGLTIVSGMARGIDGAVHEASINTGSVAVLAGGADVVYPTENAQIYEALVNHGAIISEMPLGTTIDATLFPRRNRIIAGLAHGVILVEAGAHSGSLITAQYALEYGKEIFAVPGFPTESRSKGCNGLIKQGAILTECPGDVLNVMSRFFPLTLTSQDPAAQIPAEESCTGSFKDEILMEISRSPVSIEALFQSQQCSLPRLLSTLTELELEGKIQRHHNNEVSLALV